MKIPRVRNQHRPEIKCLRPLFSLCVKNGKTLHPCQFTNATVDLFEPSLLSRAWTLEKLREAREELLSGEYASYCQNCISKDPSGVCHNNVSNGTVQSDFLHQHLSEKSESHLKRFSSIRFYHEESYLNSLGNNGDNTRIVNQEVLDFIAEYDICLELMGPSLEKVHNLQEIISDLADRKYEGKFLRLCSDFKKFNFLDGISKYIEKIPQVVIDVDCSYFGEAYGFLNPKHSFDEFIKNVLLIDKEYSNVEIRFRITLNILNAFNFSNILETLVRNGFLKNKGSMTLLFSPSESPFSLSRLPLKSKFFLEGFFDQCLDNLKSHLPEDVVFSYKENIKNSVIKPMLTVFQDLDPIRMRMILNKFERDATIGANELFSEPLKHVKF